jgi:hypothetical protein
MGGEGTSAGQAYSTSGTYAYNNPTNVTPTTDYAYYWQGLCSGEYGGTFAFTGSLGADFEGDVGYPSFNISADVSGGSNAGGELVISDPNSSWGGFDAYADYYASGASCVYVTW